jgi:hypothetical protein
MLLPVMQVLQAPEFPDGQRDHQCVHKLGAVKNSPLQSAFPGAARAARSGCATSRREAALPKNEVRTRHLKTHLSAFEF